jgi:iron complex outermembrane receptor protein
MKKRDHSPGLHRALPGLLLAGTSGWAVGALPAAAQDQESRAEATLQEVVVTARLREESILEVPISMTALTAENIRESDIDNVRDLGAFAPGLNFQVQVGNGPGGRNSGSIIFRGMSPVQGTAREQSGSVFVDGIFVSSGVQSVDTTDVERIEILRGPQNAYFGRSTFGGAINFVTRTPGDTIKGGLTVGAGQRDGYELRGNIEGPLIEGKLSGRISAATFQRAWQYRATDGGELGAEKTESVTATLFATPAESWDLKLRAHFQKDDDGPMTHSYIRGRQYGSTCPGQTFRGIGANGAPTQFALSRPYFCGSVPELGSLPANFVTSNTSLFPNILAQVGRPNYLVDILSNNALNSQLMTRVPTLDGPGLRRDITRVSLQSNYAFGNGITLTANVGYEQNFGNMLYDVDRADVENAYSVLPQLYRSKSGELRLQSGQDQRIRWLVGYSYLELQSELQQIGYQIQVALGAPPPTVGFLNPRQDDRSEVPAMFGSIEFDLLENLTLGAEVRRQTDKSSLLNANFTRTDFEFKDTLPRAFVRWEPIDGLNLYGTWGKGVMPGQLNSAFVTATPAQQAEICAQLPSCGAAAPLPEVTNREIGVKQRLMNGRLQYAVSVYDMDWVNINTNQSVVVSTTPFVLGIIAPNDARLRGVEFEGRFLVTPEWDVGLNFNLQDNEYTKIINGTLASLTSGVVRFDGNEVPKQPDRTATLSSGYRGRLNDSWGWTLRGEASYTGRMWDSEANIAQTEAFTRVNARFGFEKDNLDIELYGRNIFDDDSWNYIGRSTSVSEPGALLLVPYPTATSPLTTVQGLMLTPPDRREFGVRMNYRF